MGYTTNVNLMLNASVDSGSPDLTIQIYEWSINDIIQINNTNTLIINTNTLKILPEINNVKLRVQNSAPCNKWSDYVSKEITVINEVNKMEKIINIIVDEPIENVSIVMDTVGTVNVTVINTTGTPIYGATLDLDGISTGLTTDVDGKASILNVPYGTHTLKATKI